MFAAKTLLKMAPPGLTFGEHCVDFKQGADPSTMAACREMDHN